MRRMVFLMVALVMVLTWSVPSGYAGEFGSEQIEGRWGLGFRVGGAFPLGEIAGVTPDPGPIISLNAMYGLTRYLVPGVNLEFQTHTGSAGSFSDRSYTTSIMPFVEFRPVQYGALSPYASLGLGVNINSTDEADSVDPAIALKVAGGADYFLSNSLALNFEAGWKSNHTDVYYGGRSRTFNLETFSVLVGLRWYMPR
jgi:hypothetical protein